MNNSLGNIDSFYINPSPSLPYILLPNSDKKLLIDTGSSKTILNPNFVYENFPETIYESPFEITTSHGTTLHQYVADVPILSLFNEEGTHQVYLFDFHPSYIGLIGSDLLSILPANIDYKWQHIQTEKTVVPFYYNETLTKQQKQKRNYCNFMKPQTQATIAQINIEPRSERFVKLPAVGKNGVKLAPKIKFNENLIMPSAIVKLKNNYFITSIINISNEPQSLTIDQPLYLDDYTDFEQDPVQINNHDINSDKKTTKQKLLENLNENLRLDHLNPEEKSLLTNLCHEYKDIFYHPEIPLSSTNLTKHHIRTKTDEPIFTKTYRYPHCHRDEVRSQINRMLDQKIIEPSESPYNFPIWIVPKKLDASGKRKFRIVIDYRKLNENTIEDKFPLPCIETVLDRLGRSVYYTTIDLASGFHQIEIEPKDREKTAFSTEEGHYQFRRMPFGLKNAPAAFQRMINTALTGLTPLQCMVYLDDVIIYSTSLQEHIQRLKNIFQRCRDTNLKIQLDKSEFLQKTVKYLGHIITPDGIKPDPSKIESIKKFPLPKTRTEIKSFLGLLGYYRKFIKDFAKITKFLTVCLKKDNKIIHNQNFIDSFEYLKTILTNEPILAYPDFNQRFELTTDASKFALGAVLSQNSKPICFASRTLNETEQRYSTIERELLAIVWATKNFRPYLFGTNFVLYTDHRPLVWLKNLKEPNSKLTRWALKLEEFNFEIKYLPGKTNKVADALSRVQIHPLTINDDIMNDIDDVLSDTNKITTPEPNLDPTNMSIIPERPYSPDLSDFDIPIFNPPSDVLLNNPSIPQGSNENDNNSLIDTIHTQLESTPTIDICEKPLQCFPRQIEFIEAILPRSIKVTTFDNNKHFSVFLNQSNKNTKFHELMIEHCEPKTHYYCYFSNDKLYQDFSQYIISVSNENSPKFHRCMTQVTYVTDPEARKEIIQNYHLGKTNHRGINETYEHLLRKYYWKSMHKDIEQTINNCDICKQQKYNRHPLKQPLQMTPTYSRPFYILHMDIFQINNQKYLTLIDSFSKFAQAYSLRSSNLIDITDRLFYFITTYTAPRILVVDNELNKQPLKSFAQLHQITLHATTPYNHTSNSPVERLHSTLIEQYRLLGDMSENRKIPYAIMAYNHTIHSNLNYTPFEILFGHTEGKNPFELDYTKTFLETYVNDHKIKMKDIYENLADKQKQTKDKRNEKINKSRKTHVFKINDRVYVKTNERNKKKPRFTGPYVITKIHEHDTYDLRNEPTGSTLKRHANDLLPFSEQPSLHSSPGPSSSVK